jgi:hypothetical protein
MIVKQAWVQASLVWAIGLVSLLVFYRRTRNLYVNGMQDMPLLVAQMAPRARVPATVSRVRETRETPGASGSSLSWAVQSRSFCSRPPHLPVSSTMLLPAHYQVYVPPPLQNGGLLWWPEFNKTWALFGMPGYSW